MTYEDMLPTVLPYVKGCPDETAVHHLLKAARHFCNKTLVWYYKTKPIAGDPSVDTYALQIERGQELVRLISCSVDSTPYSVPSGATGIDLQSSGASNVCLVVNAQDIKLSPAPSRVGAEIETVIAVRPSIRDFGRWPDDYAEHEEAIADGAIASLCSMPNETWTDMKTAALKDAAFRDRIASVGIKVSKGFGRTHHGSNVRWI